MKPPTPAPVFACFYPGLCEIARGLGYCLAIHGSLVTDMDIVAIPWTDEAKTAEEVVTALTEHLNACDYAGYLRAHGTPEQYIPAIVEREGSMNKAPKPHGRRAWNLYLTAGIKIDLSVMPRRQESEAEALANHFGN